MLLLSTAGLRVAVVRQCIMYSREVAAEELDRSKCKVNSVRRIDQNMAKESEKECGGHSFSLSLCIHEEKLGE